MFVVKITKRAEKDAALMPISEQKKLRILMMAMEATGPVQGAWPNYSKLGPDRHHCHLSRNWVAVWTFKKNILTIEVTHACNRKDAPY